MKRIATTNAPAALGPMPRLSTGDTVYCSGQLVLDPPPAHWPRACSFAPGAQESEAVLQRPVWLDNVVITVFVQDRRFRHP